MQVERKLGKEEVIVAVPTSKSSSSNCERPCRRLSHCPTIPTDYIAPCFFLLTLVDNEINDVMVGLVREWLSFLPQMGGQCGQRDVR